MVSNKDAIQKAKEKHGDRLDAVVDVFTMRFICTSKNFRDILGYKTEEETLEFGPRNILSLDPQSVLMHMAKIVAGQTKKDVQPLKKKDGSKIKVRADMKPFVIDGEPFLAAVDMSISPEEETPAQAP